MDALEFDLNVKKRAVLNSGPRRQVGYSNFDGVYDAVLMTGKGTFIVGKQQMTFNYKFFPLKDSGQTNPHLKTLCTVMGRVPRPSQFTETQGNNRTDPTDSDDQPDVTMMDAESGQTGGVT